MRKIDGSVPHEVEHIFYWDSQLLLCLVSPQVSSDKILFQWRVIWATILDYANVRQGTATALGNGDTTGFSMTWWMLSFLNAPCSPWHHWTNLQSGQGTSWGQKGFRCRTLSCWISTTLKPLRLTWMVLIEFIGQKGYLAPNMRRRGLGTMDWRPRFKSEPRRLGGGEEGV